jgi:hypothetical protein
VYKWDILVVYILSLVFTNVHFVVCKNDYKIRYNNQHDIIDITVSNITFHHLFIHF